MTEKSAGDVLAAEIEVAMASERDATIDLSDPVRQNLMKTWLEGMAKEEGSLPPGLQNLYEILSDETEEST